MSNHNYTKYSKVNPAENSAPETANQSEETTAATPEVKPASVRGIVANCKRLNVRTKPSIDAKVICVIDVDTNLTVDEESSTADWYKVTLENGKYGYTMKKYIIIQ